MSQSQSNKKQFCMLLPCIYQQETYLSMQTSTSLTMLYAQSLKLLLQSDESFRDKNYSIEICNAYV